MILSSGDRSSLLVADLHLGLHRELETRTGAVFDSEQEAITHDIEKLIRRYRVDNLWIVGDLKHSIGVDTGYNWSEIPKFLDRLSSRVNVTILPGNHDGEIRALVPRRVVIGDARGCTVWRGELVIAAVHGHAWPSPEVLSADVIVMGHNHPAIRIIHEVPLGSGGRVRRRGMPVPVFLKMPLSRQCVARHARMNSRTERRGEAVLFVMPSFNPLAAGVNIGRADAKLRGPMIESGCADKSQADVYSENGVFLGDLASLSERTNESIK